MVYKWSKSLDELQNLKVVKQLFTVKSFGKRIYGEGGTNAESVYLLEGDIVKKKYEMTDRGRKIFKKEIKILKHLSTCPFVARLINYDASTLTFYISYCGEKPPDTPENKETIYKLLKKLHKKWGVVRHKRGKVSYKISRSNTGLYKGQIYLFDIAGNKWSILKK